MSSYSSGFGVHAGGVLDRDDALLHRLVRERRPVHEVADRVDLRDVRAHHPVDGDQAALVELDARRVEPQALDVRSAARGDDEPVRLALIVAVREGHGRLARLHVCHERLRVDVDALLLEAARGRLADVGVLDGQHAVQPFEQLDLRAQAHIGARDLGARGARADHGERLGQLLERPGLLRSDHAAREARSRDRLLHRTGCDDDRLARLELLTPDRHGARSGQRAVPFVHVDLVLLEQHPDAAGERGDDLAAALHDLAEVDGRLADVHAELARLADLLRDVRGA